MLGIEKVAAQVTDAFRGHEFTAVCILKGSCIFAADLIRRIPIPVRLAFAQAQSYRAGVDPGELRLDFLPADGEVQGARILLVDDILDSGRTLAAVRRRLTALGASEVRTCVFLDKPARRAVPFEADYRCFEVDDEFVVGYGLDYDGRYRNLPYVGTLRAEVYTSSQVER